MGDISLDGLLKNAGNPQVEKNAQSITAVLNDINGFLTKFGKTASLISSTFEKLGLPSDAIIRIIGKKLGVPDIDKPIQRTPKTQSKTHKALFEKLAGLSEEQLKKIEIVQKEVKK